MDAGGHGFTADSYNDFLFGGAAGADQVAANTGVMAAIAHKMPASFDGPHDADMRQVGMDFGQVIRDLHSKPLPQAHQNVIFPIGEGPEQAHELMKHHTAMLQHQMDSPIGSHLDVATSGAPLWWEGARGPVDLGSYPEFAGAAAGVKVAKAGVLVAASGLFSKVLGLGLLGYVAVQAMEAIAGEQPKEEEHALQEGLGHECATTPPVEAACAA